MSLRNEIAIASIKKRHTRKRGDRMNIWRLGTNWGGIPTLNVIQATLVGFFGIDWPTDGVEPDDIIAIATPGRKTVEAVGIAASRVQSLSEMLNQQEQAGELSRWVGDAKGFRLKKIWTIPKEMQFSTSDYKQFYSLRNDPDAWNKALEIVNFMQCEEKMNNFCNLLTNCKNLILTGAPGTGKTYLAREIAYALTGDTAENHPHVGFCQFHPSYDYTDFVEGIRPCENETTGVQFSRRNGIFKDFCISALKGTTQDSQDNFEEVWNKLVSILEEKRYLDIPLLTGNASFLIEMNEYGTGLANRTYASDEAKQRGEWINGQSKFFSKDQLYNIYRGLPGIPSGGHDNYRKAVVKFLKANYGLKDYKPGSETPQDTQQPFVFIIDEINRGDISKIFGELFFALDPGYRGKKGAIKTQYANLAPADDPFKDGFYIPKNVFVIGTMNDIDRGVESMDFAIRRRFTWIQVKPEDRLSMWNDNLSSDVMEEAEKRMRSLNVAIAKEEVLGPAYQIGPAYFLKLADYKSSAFENLWSWHIEPLIEEYLRGIPDAKQIMQKLYKKYQLTDEVPAEN